MLEAIGRLRRIKAAYREVFEAPAGKAVLNDILVSCNVLRTSMDADPHVTSFNEGRRSMALEIVEKLRWNEGELVRLSQARTQDQLEEIADEAA